MFTAGLDDHRRTLRTQPGQATATACMDMALLKAVTEEFAAYLSEVTDGDLTAPTPCALWTVDDLYHHMLELDVELCRALGRRPPPPAASGGYVFRETVYRDSARHTAEALAHAPADSFEAHLTNTLIHTWDLARAIQIDFDPPRPDALDIALGCLRRMPPDARGEGRAFAAAPDFPAGSAMEEVLLLSGRFPGWRPWAGRS